MKKILIFLTAIFLSIGAFGQTKTNLRVMLDSLNNKLNKRPLDSLGWKGTQVAGYDGSDTVKFYEPVSGTIELEDVAVMHVDTVGGSSLRDLVVTPSGSMSPLETSTMITDTMAARLAVAKDIRVLDSDTITLFVFGMGSGNSPADTALFNNNRLIGSFLNEESDTLIITKLNGVLKAGTGAETISVQISWHATFLSGSATSLNAAALAITDVEGTGTVDTSFANNAIPPGVRIWGILSGASKDNKPTYLEVSLIGYKRNRTY